MVGASLLQSDDDSDVPDLDLRCSSGDSSRRRTFFSKPTSDYEEIRHRRKTYKTILLLSFLFVFLIALYFLYSAVSRIRILSDEVQALHGSMKTMEELELELKKMRMEFEVLREGDLEKAENATRPVGRTSGLIYDKLTNISGRFDVLFEGFQKNSMSMEDVTSRMSRVENKCLAVCQHDGLPRGREQPRRRQAAGKGTNKVGSGDEIVFRRND